MCKRPEGVGKLKKEREEKTKASQCRRRIIIKKKGMDEEPKLRKKVREGKKKRSKLLWRRIQVLYRFEF